MAALWFEGGAWLYSHLAAAMSVNRPLCGRDRLHLAACFSKMLSCGPLLPVGNISALCMQLKTVYLKEQSPFFSTISALLRLTLSKQQHSPHVYVLFLL